MHESSRSLDEGASRRSPGDGYPAAAAELEQPLVAEKAERPEDRIRVHAEDGGEVPRRREPLARFRFAVGDRSSDLRRNLLELDLPHGAIYPSFIDEALQHPWPRLAALIEQARRRARRRRILLAAVAAAAAVATGLGLYFGLRGGSAASTAHTPIRFTNPPYLGMSCRGGGVSCGRFGVAVWLANPADSVEVTVLGQRVTLAAPEASRDYWRGFARVAALNYTHAIPVRVRIVVHRGDAIGVTTRRAMLREGWG